MDRNKLNQGARYRTSLDVIVLQSTIDSDGAGGDFGEDATNVTLLLVRIGDLSGDWDYSMDLDLATDDAGPSDCFYDARVMLFPARSLGFGASVSGSFGSDRSGLTDLAIRRGTSFGLLVNCFPTETIGLEAGYGFSDIDEGSVSDADEDIYSLSAVFRF